MIDCRCPTIGQLTVFLTAVNLFLFSNFRFLIARMFRRTQIISLVLQLTGLQLPIPITSGRRQCFMAMVSPAHCRLSSAVSVYNLSLSLTVLRVEQRSSRRTNRFPCSSFWRQFVACLPVKRLPVRPIRIPPTKRIFIKHPKTESRRPRDRSCAWTVHKELASLTKSNTECSEENCTISVPIDKFS